MDSPFITKCARYSDLTIRNFCTTITALHINMFLNDCHQIALHPSAVVVVVPLPLIFPLHCIAEQHKILVPTRPNFSPHPTPFGQHIFINTSCHFSPAFPRYEKWADRTELGARSISVRRENLGECSLVPTVIRNTYTGSNAPLVRVRCLRIFPKFVPACVIHGRSTAEC